jgi:hypothetical protein
VDASKSKIFITAAKEGASVTYTAPADVTARSIKADLGSFGKIDMRFHPSGRKVRRRPAGCDFKLTSATGSFHGRFRFKGESGYVRASARVARWSVPPLELGQCTRLADEPGKAGKLEVLKRFPDRSRIYFSVVKTGPEAPAYFGSSITEKHGRVGIERSVLAVGPAMSFTYNSTVVSGSAVEADAHVQFPPGPFSGEGTYQEARPGPGQFTQSWAGTLAVRFPGDSQINLSGPGYLSGLNVEP